MMYCAHCSNFRRVVFRLAEAGLLIYIALFTLATVHDLASVVMR